MAGDEQREQGEDSRKSQRSMIGRCDFCLVVYFLDNGSPQIIKLFAKSAFA